MKISGLIVVAGLSSRMNDFKPLMKIENKPLIINAINSLRRCNIEDINIVVGYRGNDIEQYVKDQNVNVIYNNKYKSNFMYDSFKIGLDKIKDSCDGVIFLPGDVGFVSKYTIDLLINEINKNKTKIVYPIYKNEVGHPPIISSKCFDYLLNYNGKNGLRGGMDYFKMESKKIDTPDRFILYDMDYKRDFYKVKYDFENREILSDKDCIYLLDYFNASKAIINHGKKVKEICEDLSKLINNRKNIIDVNLVNAAAILHDIKRQEKKHSEVGANLLDSLGYKKIANVVRSHMKLEAHMKNLINENTILYYGDKLVEEDQFVGLDNRFKEKLNIYKDNQYINNNIIDRYEDALKIKSNIISIVGIKEYEKLEDKWRDKNGLFK